MRRLTVCLTAVLLLCGVLAAAPAAGAASPPGIRLVSAPTRITAGHSWTFGYSATHLRRHSHIDLQLLEGGTWTSIVHGKAVHGSVKGNVTTEGPGELGTYVVRLAVRRSGTTVVATRRHTVYAYGTVSMGALCHGVFHLGKEECVTGGADAGDGTTFHYVMNTVVNGQGQHAPQIKVPAISCRSITFRYDGDTGEQNTFVLHQHGAAALKRVSRDDHVQSVQAKLNGQRFTVTVNQNDGNLFFYWNGHASCYTATGKA